jgi:hypothetical protein
MEVFISMSRNAINNLFFFTNRSIKTFVNYFEVNPLFWQEGNQKKGKIIKKILLDVLSRIQILFISKCF